MSDDDLSFYWHHLLSTKARRISDTLHDLQEDAQALVAIAAKTADEQGRTTDPDDMQALHKRLRDLWVDYAEKGMI